MMALSVADPQLAARYRDLAVEYKMLAATAADDTVPQRSVTDNLSGAAGEGEAS
jgi:hypothetical protein